MKKVIKIQDTRLVLDKLSSYAPHVQHFEDRTSYIVLNLYMAGETEETSFSFRFDTEKELNYVVEVLDTIFEVVEVSHPDVVEFIGASSGEDN